MPEDSRCGAFPAPEGRSGEGQGSRRGVEGEREPGTAELALDRTRPRRMRGRVTRREPWPSPLPPRRPHRLAPPPPRPYPPAPDPSREAPLDHKERLAELRRRGEQALAGGGPERVAKMHEKGCLTARERLELLLAPGSFVEIGTFVTHRSQDFGMDQRRPVGDGVVAG